MSAVNICPRSGIWNAFDRFTPRAVTRRISPACTNHADKPFRPSLSGALRDWRCGLPVR